MKSTPPTTPTTSSPTCTLNHLNTFQTNLLLKLFDEDYKNVLLVMAKGLGIEVIIVHLLRMYCDPSQLVLIINASPREEELIKQLLLESGLVKMENIPKSITSTFTNNERKELYDQGGCLFVTSRILIVDLLNDKVPIDLVSGIVVLNAHHITEKSTEAFILRVFRMKNKTAFVKGFTENPEDLARGFSKLEDVMKLLFVDKVEFKPRFDVEVAETLSKYQPTVSEIIVPMTERMSLIESCIVDIITTSLESLKKNNPSLDLSEVQIEDCYFKSFHSIIMSQLRPIWNRIGVQSKKLIEDLKSMRTLLFYLLNYDCVTFYDYLETLRLSDGKNGIPSSNWLLTDTASDIYMYAKERIYTIGTSKLKSPLKKQKTLTQMAQGRQVDPYVQVDSINFVLEENPKWHKLEETLDSIYQIIRTTTNPNINGRVLILASNDKSCSQVRTYLELGGKTLLNRLIHKLIGPHIKKQQRKLEKEKMQKLGQDEKKSPKKNTKKKGAKKKDMQQNELDLLSQHVSAYVQDEEEVEKSILEESILVHHVENDSSGDEAEIETDSEEEPEIIQVKSPSKKKKEVKNQSNKTTTSNSSASSSSPYTPKTPPQSSHPLDDFFEIIESEPMTTEMQLVVHSLYDTVTILDELMPSFVVLYENDLAFVRKLEQYQCKYPFIPLHVYLISYDRKSVEYKQYCATVEREKEAFKKLIMSYGRMTVPSMDTLLSNIILRERRTQSESAKLVPKAFADTRKAGGNLAVIGSSSQVSQGEFNFGEKSRIIIDAREFRSSLPSLLNLSGYRVIPIQISVGDYILSKHCCVERKSTSDLWQSLGSGRLFQQAENMVKYYKHAILLVQFEEDEAFALPDPYPGYLTREDGKIEEKSIITKLVLTVTHFPKLKIAYSRSPAVTGKYFYMMKHQVLPYNDFDMSENEEDYEPDIALAQAIGTSNHEEETESTNQAIDFLSRMPGVTTENMSRIMNSVTNLYELCDLSLDELTEIMNSKENAKRLYDFLNDPIDME